MTFIDRVPLRPAPADLYTEDWWERLDNAVLGASIGPRRNIPRHVEVGLSDNHHVRRESVPWWRTRGLWREVLYFVILAAVLIAAIFFSGRSVNLP
jgi:hypothetical protein